MDGRIDTAMVAQQHALLAIDPGNWVLIAFGLLLILALLDSVRVIVFSIIRATRAKGKARLGYASGAVFFAVSAGMFFLINSSVNDSIKTPLSWIGYTLFFISGAVTLINLRGVPLAPIWQRNKKASEAGTSAPISQQPSADNSEKDQ